LGAERDREQEKCQKESEADPKKTPVKRKRRRGAGLKGRECSKVRRTSGVKKKGRLTQFKNSRPNKGKKPERKRPGRRCDKSTEKRRGNWEGRKAAKRKKKGVRQMSHVKKKSTGNQAGKEKWSRARKANRESQRGWGYTKTDGRYTEQRLGGDNGN